MTRAIASTLARRPCSLRACKPARRACALRARKPALHSLPVRACKPAQHPALSGESLRDAAIYHSANLTKPNIDKAASNRNVQKMSLICVTDPDRSYDGPPDTKTGSFANRIARVDAGVACDQPRRPGELALTARPFA